ncbi:hypothetical protein B0O99DRAFT_635372 [Bisporella sp. PMI_857]|nr:hypothetical protein B0O99DRAFT_635372 [Bisporella sp. PMI_857]
MDVTLELVNQVATMPEVCQTVNCTSMQRSLSTRIENHSNASFNSQLQSGVAMVTDESIQRADIIDQAPSSPEFGCPIILVKQNIEADDTDSDDYILVLTPSSSCMSLDSVYHAMDLQFEVNKSTSERKPAAREESRIEVLDDEYRVPRSWQDCNSPNSETTGQIRSKLKVASTGEVEAGDLSLVALGESLRGTGQLEPKYVHSGKTPDNLGWDGSLIRNKAIDVQRFSWLESHLFSKHIGRKAAHFKHHDMQTPCRTDPDPLIRNPLPIHVARRNDPLHLPPGVGKAPVQEGNIGQSLWNTEEELINAKMMIERCSGTPFTLGCERQRPARRPYPTQGWRDYSGGKETMKEKGQLPWWKTLLG